MSEISSLLIAYHTQKISRIEFMHRLIVGDVFIIASYNGPNNSTINIQDFVREGKSFIPFFSNVASAKRLLAGASLGPKVQLYEAKVDYLAGELVGPEWLVINAGDSFMFDLYAHELKSILSGARPSFTPETKIGTVEGHRNVLTVPTSMKIGMPSDPPSSNALLEMQRAISSTTANSAHWFWMSKSGENGHLGLAVTPGDAATINQIGNALQPIWKKYRPDNSLITIVSLETAGLLEVVRVQGKLLYQRQQ